jgi:hypothetical protein
MPYVPRAVGGEVNRKPKSWNPVAKVVRRIRPKIVPDKRRKLLAKATENATLRWSMPAGWETDGI